MSSDAGSYLPGEVVAQSTNGGQHSQCARDESGWCGGLPAETVPIISTPTACLGVVVLETARQALVDVYFRLDRLHGIRGGLRYFYRSCCRGDCGQTEQDRKRLHDIRGKEQGENLARQSWTRKEQSLDLLCGARERDKESRGTIKPGFLYRSRSFTFFASARGWETLSFSFGLTEPNEPT